MTEAERVIYLRFAWFPPDTVLLGKPARPLSFATWNAMKLMGLRLLDTNAELSPIDEFRQLLVYRWLHEEPEEEVSRALWSESWREILDSVEDDEEPPMALLSQWREERERILALLKASEIKIQPRPDSGKDETPMDVVGPDEMAHRLSVVQSTTNRTDHEILWLMPLYQFNQRYHSEMRWQRFWTVRPAVAAPPADFTDFGESVMSNLQKQEAESATDEHPEAD